MKNKTITKKYLIALFFFSCLLQKAFLQETEIDNIKKWKNDTTCSEFLDNQNFINSDVENTSVFNMGEGTNDGSTQ